MVVALVALEEHEAIVFPNEAGDVTDHDQEHGHVCVHGHGHGDDQGL